MCWQYFGPFNIRAVAEMCSPWNVSAHTWQHVHRASVIQRAECSRVPRSQQKHYNTVSIEMNESLGSQFAQSSFLCEYATAHALWMHSNSLILWFLCEWGLSLGWQVFTWDHLNQKASYLNVCVCAVIQVANSSHHTTAPEGTNVHARLPHQRPGLAPGPLQPLPVHAGITRLWQPRPLQPSTRQLHPAPSPQALQRPSHLRCTSPPNSLLLYTLPTLVTAYWLKSHQKYAQVSWGFVLMTWYSDMRCTDFLDVCSEFFQSSLFTV